MLENLDRPSDDVFEKLLAAAKGGAPEDLERLLIETTLIHDLVRHAGKRTRNSADVMDIVNEI
jgi:hypothetical protein